jgi:hypothetical protein
VPPSLLPSSDYRRRSNNYEQSDDQDCDDDRQSMANWSERFNLLPDLWLFVEVG